MSDEAAKTLANGFMTGCLMIQIGLTVSALIRGFTA